MNRYSLTEPKKPKPPLLTDEEVVAYIDSLEEPEKTEALKTLAYWSINSVKKNRLMKDHRSDPQTIVNTNPRNRSLRKRIKNFHLLIKLYIARKLKKYLLPRFERWLRSRGYYGQWREKSVFKLLGDGGKEVGVPTMAPLDPNAPQISVASNIDRAIEIYEIMEDIGPRGELARNFFETIDHPETEAALIRDTDTDSIIEMGQKP